MTVDPEATGLGLVSTESNLYVLSVFTRTSPAGATFKKLGATLILVLGNCIGALPSTANSARCNCVAEHMDYQAASF